LLRICIGLAALAVCCGCATYMPASFPLGEGRGAANEEVVGESDTVRLTLTNGQIEEGKVVSVSETHLVLASESEAISATREFQAIEVESIQVRSSAIGDKATFVTIAGVSALIAVVSISSFEEPDG